MHEVTRPEIELLWPGKRDSLALARAPAEGALWAEVGAPSAHRLVVGDNLPCLKLLRPELAGAVDLICIDPPYNTGNRFVYRDRLGGSAAWLDMVLPRLVVARDLLAPGGIIAVFIDDRELPRLRLLLDEVMGEANFLCSIAWQKAYTPNATAKHISWTHEYLVVYALDAAAARLGRDPRTAAQLAAFENPDDDPRGPWKAENLSAGRPYRAGRFTITTPTGLEVRPPPGRYWRCSEPRYREWLEGGRIWFGADGTGRPMLKKYLADVQPGLTPQTWWPHETVGSTKSASTALKRLMGGQCFDSPKPVPLLQRTLRLLNPDGGLVLDFFAGSGTLGEAVYRSNALGEPHRRFVLVQSDEPVRTEVPYETVAEITAERLRRAGTLVRAEGGLGDLGFALWRHRPG